MTIPTLNPKAVVQGFGFRDPKATFTSKCCDVRAALTHITACQDQAKGRLVDTPYPS